MKKETIIFAILIIGFLASCGPKRYGCGPRRCEIKKTEVPILESYIYNKKDLA
jgi:hypothetical protein